MKIFKQSFMRPVKWPLRRRFIGLVSTMMISVRAGCGVKAFVKGVENPETC